jgi:dihydroorotase
MPHDVDHKIVEFENAEAGMIALETAFSTLITALGTDYLDGLVQLLSQRPREIFGLPALSVQPGGEARLTLFNPSENWTPTAFQSRSRNSPFAGRTLQGKVLGIINKEKVFLNQSTKHEK